MHELSRLAAPDEVLLVAQGSPEQAERFFAPRWPEARVVSDSEQALYPRFGLERAGLRQLLDSSVLRAFWHNMGHGVGLPVGDSLLLGGSFVLEGRRVLFAHPAETPADHPDWNRMLDLVRSARGAAR